ncbi:MAG: DUF4931 domain-containing protein [Calditrichaeota bacterium]|nr:MAG: DUF4931 domain-containing protein [Calditrichota bacterium]
MTQIIEDSLFGYSVVLAPKRMQRPHVESSEKCPFCPGHEFETPATILQYPETGTWRIRSFANKYPIVDDSSAHLAGRQEVVVETPVHDRRFHDMSKEEMARVVLFISKRLNSLYKDRRFVWSTWFKNQGPLAGASVNHAHSQLVSLGFIPKAIREAQARARNYYKTTRQCLLCDRAQKKRALSENAFFKLIVHPAGRLPWQMQIIPRAHAALFDVGRMEVAEALADLIRRALHALLQIDQNVSYNLVLHNGTSKSHDRYHWSLDIVPRLAQMAGLEWATGLYVQPLSPQQAFDTLHNLIRGKNE